MGESYDYFFGFLPLSFMYSLGLFLFKNENLHTQPKWHVVEMHYSADFEG